MLTDGTNAKQPHAQTRTQATRTMPWESEGNYTPPFPLPSVLTSRSTVAVLTTKPNFIVSWSKDLKSLCYLEGCSSQKYDIFNDTSIVNNYLARTFRCWLDLKYDIMLTRLLKI